MIDYTTLFETAHAEFGFENPLDAITSGEAKMLSTVGSLHDDPLINLEKEASDRGFVTVKSELAIDHIAERHRQIQLFIIKNVEEIWRIPAYISVQAARYKYESILKPSNFFRMIERVIRGYSEEYIRKLSTFEDFIQIDYGLATVYIIMSIDYEHRLRPLGYRCLDPGTVEDMPKIVIFKGKLVSLKQDAAALVEEGYTIARVGVAWHRLLSFLEQINAENSDSIYIKLDGFSLQKFNGIIETKIELFRGGAWILQD